MSENSSAKQTIAVGNTIIGNKSNPTSSDFTRATSICSTEAGEVYMTDGTDDQVRAAWRILAAHREISYAGFDTTKIYVVQLSSSPNSELLFLPVNNSGSSQSVLTFADFGTPDASPIVVESTTQSITYKDYTSDKQVQVVNSSKGVIATATSISSPGTPVNQRAMSVGAAQCIQHAYSNNGWISVWAFVQTLAIPATGVAIAGACILHNI